MPQKTQTTKFSFQTFLIKLTGRKFIIAIGTTVAILLQARGYSDSFITTVVSFIAAALCAVTFILVEGWKDAKTATATGLTADQIVTIIQEWFEAFTSENPTSDGSVEGSIQAVTEEIKQRVEGLKTTGTSTKEE